MRGSLIVMNGGDAVVDNVAAMFEKPLQVLAKDIERFNPPLLQAFDGVERNEADQRSHPEGNDVSVGKSQQVVEEAILLVPQRPAAALHLHRRADVDVVLEELGGQPLID